MGTPVRGIWAARGGGRIAGAGGLILALLAGCKTLYAPNVAPAPLLTQKGELRATADVRNLQVAYAAGAHVGLMANAYFRSESKEQDNGEQQDGSGLLLEAGAGYFTKFPGKFDWLLFEAYGGAGLGHVAHEVTPMGGTTRTFDADGLKLFVLPSIGMTFKYVDLALSGRLTTVRYFGTSSENYNQSQLEGDNFAGIEDTTWVFFEPAITGRIGYKWIKLQVQLGQSLKLNSAELNRDKGMFSIALHLDLFRMFDPPEDE
jgi:hypothetical protein